jgi:hypothetical protein
MRSHALQLVRWHGRLEPETPQSAQQQPARRIEALGWPAFADLIVPATENVTQHASEADGRGRGGLVGRVPVPDVRGPDAQPRAPEFVVGWTPAYNGVLNEHGENSCLMVPILPEAP